MVVRPWTQKCRRYSQFGDEKEPFLYSPNWFRCAASERPIVLLRGVRCEIRAVINKRPVHLCADSIWCEISGDDNDNAFPSRRSSRISALYWRGKTRARFFNPPYLLTFIKTGPLSKCLVFVERDISVTKKINRACVILFKRFRSPILLVDEKFYK